MLDRPARLTPPHGWSSRILAALTLRHRIPRTSANSFEPYFHPRMLAFGIGLLAVASLLRRRTWLSIALVASHGADSRHDRSVVLDPDWRRAGDAGASIAASGHGRRGGGCCRWRLGADGGPAANVDDTDGRRVAAGGGEQGLALRLAVAAVGVDRQSRAARACCGGPTCAVSARAQATAEDDALVWGATALVAFFLLTLPLVVARLAFPVQLQISRVFWLVDALATIYLLVAACRSAGRQSRRDRAGDRLSLARRLHHARRASRPFALLDAPGGVAVGGRHALAVAATDRHARARRSGTLLEVRHERARVRRRATCSWKT